MHKHKRTCEILINRIQQVSDLQPIVMQEQTDTVQLCKNQFLHKNVSEYHNSSNCDANENRYIRGKE